MLSSGGGIDGEKDSFDLELKSKIKSKTTHHQVNTPLMSTDTPLMSTDTPLMSTDTPLMTDPTTTTQFSLNDEISIFINSCLSLVSSSSPSNSLLDPIICGTDQENDSKMFLSELLSNPEFNAFYVLDNGRISTNYSNNAVISFIKQSNPAKSPKDLIFISLPYNQSKTNETTQDQNLIYNYIHYAINPLLNSGTNTTTADADSSTRTSSTSGLAMTRKKLNELELSLLQLKQQISIPDIQLESNPTIMDLISKNASPTDLLQDSPFLNTLQTMVNGWIKEIQKVTVLARDPLATSTRQEIEFWLLLEKHLLKIESQLKSPHVLLTLDVLKKAKRFHATVSFIADTGIKDSLDRVQKYNLLMKDFPVSSLLEAADFDAIGAALDSIFSHFNKKLKVSPYPINRALVLAKLLSQDLNTQILSLMSQRSLMALPFPTFKSLVHSTLRVFERWDENVKEFVSVCREMARKRSEKFIPVKVVTAHTPLQERITYIFNFRTQHEQLITTVQKVSLSDSESAKDGNDIGISSAAVSQVHVAMDSLKSVDVLDVSQEGVEAWNGAEQQYNEKVSQTETQIITKLKDKLSKCCTASDMFRVFSRFNALFVRPKIRGAVHEYQSVLMDRVKDDIKKLYEKFMAQYNQQNSTTTTITTTRMDDVSLFARSRDVPLLSATIIWTRSIETRLYSLMQKVEYVLGKGWEQYAEGQMLLKQFQSFLKSLDTRPVVQQWIEDEIARPFVGGLVFKITKNRLNGNRLELGVNFDIKSIMVFKDVRNLNWLGVSVPVSLQNMAKDAKRVYPFAVSIDETLRIYQKTLTRLDAISAANSATSTQNVKVSVLVAEFHLAIQHLVSRGVQLSWEYFINSYDVRGLSTSDNRHVAFVRDLSKCVSEFQEKTMFVLECHDEIVKLIGDIQTIPYNHTSFTSCIATIQSVIDRLNYEGVSNLKFYTCSISDRIEQALVSRLQAATKEFVESDWFNRFPDAFVCRLKIENRQLLLDPPLEMARMNWISRFNDWISVITNLDRVRVIEMGDVAVSAYSDIVSKIDVASLRQCYQKIENMYQKVSDYVQKWLKYQSLWDMQPKSVHDILGTDLSKWISTLMELKNERSTFDNSKLEARFDGIVVQYGTVQSKVNDMYDQWQRSLIEEFSLRLLDSMKNSFSFFQSNRAILEAPFSGSTKEMIDFVVLVQKLEDSLPGWTETISVFNEGQKLLQRFRFQFPSNWLYYDNVVGEWGAFKDILARKSKFVQAQKTMLSEKVQVDDNALGEKVATLESEWADKKPVDAEILPNIALASLEDFSTRIKSLELQSDMLKRAKEALGLPQPLSNELKHIMSELEDLQEVWNALKGVYDRLLVIKGLLWKSDDVFGVRSQVEDVLGSLRKMPNRHRQYRSFQHLQETVQKYLVLHNKAMALKSEALRDRHWNRILSIVELTTPFKALRVGDMWDHSGFQRKEKSVLEVLSLAQGEMALEDFLSQVSSVWSLQAFELTNFQNKCRLIKGWDELFSKCQDHLSALAAMKSSIHFKAFKDPALQQEASLTNLYSLLDVWVKVQRQWVYLQGVFTGNLEIKQILPMETSRFASIDAEFMATLRKVYKSPLVMDVLAIPNIHQTMQRLYDLLNSIQKSLGEYLERERSNFARFYFLSDEDLLEILGNSKDQDMVQPHLKKMFPAINMLHFNDDRTKIIGFSSKEQERINFSKPIEISPKHRVYEWLSNVESESKRSLYNILNDSLQCPSSNYLLQNIEDIYSNWVTKYPAQILLLTSQMKWTECVESAFGSATKLTSLLNHMSFTIKLLASTITQDLGFVCRKKCESLLTEFIHQRGVVRDLIDRNVSDPNDFTWISQMRFYPLEKSGVVVRMGNAELNYSFEYLGVQDRLVQTPLTDRCYLTLTQALFHGLGGSPFGPAGTGKTETVKSLASQLGRHCLVFCCDESFDFQSVGRIFIGLCKVGAWGCFDEFNRLEENILSAVSQQVQAIQLGLKSGTEIDVVGKSFTVNKNTGIFITMNPGYAGRSLLPDNLTSLFRAVAMTVPDRLLIAQVLLFSQGFRHAEEISAKIVPFFEICAEQLSDQQHYDFGLRALKSVLVAAGRLQRLADFSNNQDVERLESTVLVKSINETVFPKLVEADVMIAESLLENVFGPSTRESTVDESLLRENIIQVCLKHHLDPDERWIEKMLQIWTIQEINHGVMIVGNAGSGKTSAWRVLFKALEMSDGCQGYYHIIEPKAVSKDRLYGSLDQTTREWTDGIFTRILRDIIDDAHGLGNKRHWIVFDGDVDPEWIENLNSVLDDNKMLTLPSGERLLLPPNVKIMFEVTNLDQATPATVSRCGMVWFPNNLVSSLMVSKKNLSLLTSIPIEEMPSNVLRLKNVYGQVTEVQKELCDVLDRYLIPDGLVESCLFAALKYPQIMDCNHIQLMDNFFALIRASIQKVLDYNNSHPDFPLSIEQSVNFFSKSIALSVGWAFGGGMSGTDRQKIGKFITNTFNLNLGLKINSIFDAEVDLVSPEWHSLHSLVPNIHLDPQSINRTDLIIPTIDTLRHENILYSWISEHRSLILCGPPGSGKTMTLLASMRKLPNVEVVPINFSSETNYDLIIKTLEIHCCYRQTGSGEVLSPKGEDRWIVLFCDEINLPKPDSYGTQKVISFLRQLIEQNGFWRSDRVWVEIERIQIIGACNPPTDPGRVVLDNRFLRHSPVVFVDYPGEDSLLTIYGTLTRATLPPSLRSYSDALANATVSFYLQVKLICTADKAAHYIFSPRELTRWIRGIHQIISAADFVSLGDLIRTWAHEAIRLFQDRLMTQDEKTTLEKLLKETASKHFPSADLQTALALPILFSNFSSKSYESCERDSLSEFVTERLQIFYDEELDKPIVLFDMALDHILRIDRVFRQVQGHLLLIGISGSGKTTLTRFVAWMNGINVFQPSMHSKYSVADFEDDLRNVLKRAGCKGESICFMMDEANVLDSSFLERINTLLANSEIPGLFDGDEFSSLMTACKESSTRDGFAYDSHDELYQWFTKQVAKNLHVVFTMNPPSGEMSDKVTSSPALFNRCVLNWMGDWDNQAFYQVGKEFSSSIDLDGSFKCPNLYSPTHAVINLPFQFRDVVIDMLLFVHFTSRDQIDIVKSSLNISAYITPRQFIDFVTSFSSLYREKREQLEERQRHLIVGLDRLSETLIKVEELRASLSKTSAELEKKSVQANDKLKRMVEDQQNAENKRVVSVKIQKSLAEKNAQIAERRTVVQNELARAEPAVLEAQESVSGIKKQHLTEIRSMGNPPSAVKLTMESVCILLGHKVQDWKSVQAILRRDDFISNIVNYDTSKLTSSIIREITEQYLSDPNYTFELVNRASKACGPLLQWVTAQVTYASILEKVQPLRAEMITLEESAKTTQAEALEINSMVAKLEESIKIYKEEYAILISEVQVLKKEMETVKDRVDRSVRVLDNLDSESARWKQSRESFGSQMATLIGDSLLSAAYLTYGGILDQGNRSSLLQQWKTRLNESNIQYQSSLSIPDYLTMEEERRKWFSHSLPSDNLCVENAVMIQRAERYPLIIDPSGQAYTFLTSYYKHQNLAITSFRDPSFLKTLESALRFGNPILIQDAEVLDCIINPILNKEIKRSGGRNLIKLGSKDVDFSPSFKMFLMTKNPSQHFSPDISSRVSFVNFTVTHESLFLQCLDRILKSERPDIEIKRKDLLRMQGEFQYRLHHLEKALLQSLNDSTGNILDDEKVLTSLESLKKEANEVAVKVAETDDILLEVASVTSLYEPLAEKASSIYFCIEKLQNLRNIYQFSLDYFFQMFDAMLNTSPSRLDRIVALEAALFKEQLKGISVSLFQQDLVLFSMLLAKIKLSDSLHEKVVWDLFANSVPDAKDEKLSQILDSWFVSKLVYVSQKSSSLGKAVAKLGESPNLLKSVMIDSHPESTLQKHLKSINVSLTNFEMLVLLHSLRPDRFFEGVDLFLENVFGDNINSAINDKNLFNIVENKTVKWCPLVICGDKGHDVSHKVESLASSQSKSLRSVAMGSMESIQSADTAVIQGSRSGTWVLIKNAHLALPWLVSLDKRLAAMKMDNDFKLFITLEVHPGIPGNLIRNSRLVLIEPSTGMKVGLTQSFASIPKSIQESTPIEKTRLFFMLSWAHTLIMERTKYIPLGWTKNYEFGYADFDLAITLINSWMEKSALGRTNISPEKIPWVALQTLISRNVYGGKVDREVDQQVLDVIIKQCICLDVFNDEYSLIPESDGNPAVLMPNAQKWLHYQDWIAKLPDRQDTPQWLGLPIKAGELLKETQASNVLLKLSKLNHVLAKRTQDPASKSVWQSKLQSQVSKWISALPAQEQLSGWSTNATLEPALDRFFASEYLYYQSLLLKISRDLNDILRVLSNSVSTTNYIRELVKTLRENSVPASWQKVNSRLMTVESFIHSSISKFERILKVGSVKTNLSTWIGGLSDIEGYLTATRECAAKILTVSLEKLVMKCSLMKPETKSPVFEIEGLRIQGASWNKSVNKLVLIEEITSSTLPTLYISWIVKQESRSSVSDICTIPVFSTEDRHYRVFDLEVVVDLEGTKFKESDLVTRGVSVVC